MWRFVQRWLNTGTSEELGFVLNTRIRTINLAAIAGGAVSFTFTVLNSLAGNYLLALHTATNFVLLMALLYCNATKRFLWGPAVIMMLLSLILSSNGILFHNGMEFYVLLVVCLGLVLFDNLHVILLILFFNSILFLVAHRLTYSDHVQPSIQNRTFVNMVIWLILLLICLYYFKIQSLSYLRRLEKANEELKASNHSKEKLFSIVAHDMRSPLTSLVGTLDLLTHEFIDEKTFRELGSLLANQTKHLNENMDVLLKWANSQLRGIEVHPQAIDIGDCLEEVITLLKPLMDFKQIVCDIKRDDGIIAYADPDHVQLILRNLLTNAIKFSYPNGSIFVTVEPAASGEVWVGVRDEGVGMSKEVLQQLFQPNHIHSAPGTQNEKGIGLGLQLTREFVHKNGGTIRVDSVAGKGSTFSFSLPSAH